MGSRLGDAGASGSIAFDPVSAVMSWSSSNVATARIYVNGTLMVESPSGQTTIDFIRPGTNYDFSMVGWDGQQEGPQLAKLTVDSAGRVIAADAPVETGASWFEQDTTIFGAAIPNLALAAGGGLLLLAALKKRSG